MYDAPPIGVVVETLAVEFVLALSVGGFVDWL